MMRGLIDRAKRTVGPRVTARVRIIVRGYERPKWGNLRRTIPFSPAFGFERGLPIDRHYLHRFLDAHRDLIAGDVLEVQTNSYTMRYGRNIRRADTFDVVPQFRPTYLCDLAHADGVLPAGAYDCVLLPNTLQHLRELDRCLDQLRRLVRPGGAILASAAGLLPLTGDTPDYWRFSPDGWLEHLGRLWPDVGLEVNGHGNCLAATAAAMGLCVEELTDEELDRHDPRFPVLMTIAARISR